MSHLGLLKSTNPLEIAINLNFQIQLIRDNAKKEYWRTFALSGEQSLSQKCLVKSDETVLSVVSALLSIFFFNYNFP